MVSLVCGFVDNWNPVVHRDIHVSMSHWQLFRVKPWKMICPVSSYIFKVAALSRATKAQWIGHMMLWQISVSLLLFGDQGGGAQNGPKRVYFRNDSQRYVYFGSHLQGEMVRSCVNTWCNVIGNVETFESKFYNTVAIKTYWQYQWRSMETTELPVPHFLSISCKYRLYHNRQAARVRDLFIIIAVKQCPMRDWYASAISKLKYSNCSPGEIGTHRLFQNLNFQMRISRYFSLWCMTHQPSTYEMKRKSAQS